MIDLLYLIDAFGSVSGDPNYDPAADFNADDAVDVLDLLDMIDHFGCTNACSACAPTIPPEIEGGSMGRGAGDEDKPDWYVALEQVGLVDVYLDYIAQHPEAAR